MESQVAAFKLAVLAEARDHVRKALEDGRLRLSQARAIVRAAERAPKKLTREQVTAAEEAPVATATGEGSRTSRPVSAARLRDRARRVFANMLPSKPEADAAEGDDVAADEDEAERECYLSLNDRGDGIFRGSFVVPTLHGRILQAALERLNASRRLILDRAGTRPWTSQPDQRPPTERSSVRRSASSSSTCPPAGSRRATRSGC